MKKLWDMFQAWRDERRFREAKLALGILLMKKDPKIFGEMQKAASSMALQMCMKWLDNQRINHCARCPNTKTLLALNGKYYCQDHYGQATKEIVGVG